MADENRPPFEPLTENSALTRTLRCRSPPRSADQHPKRGDQASALDISWSTSSHASPASGRPARLDNMRAKRRKRRRPSLAIAGAGDHRPQDPGSKARGDRCRVKGACRRHQCAERAIEAPLRRECPPPIAGEPRMDTGPSVFERLQRRRRGKLAALDREAQTIAGHRIDESGGVTCEEQPLDRRARRLHRQRTEDHGRCDEPRVRKAIAKLRGSRPARASGARRIRERRIAGSRRPHQAHIRQATRHRRHADVAVPAHVHLAETGRTPRSALSIVIDVLCTL